VPRGGQSRWVERSASGSSNLPRPWPSRTLWIGELGAALGREVVATLRRRDEFFERSAQRIRVGGSNSVSSTSWKGADGIGKAIKAAVEAS
jgi:hypothetical protein